MEMDKLVSLCKRRGFLFQSSEIYGGLNGFWDYGPLGVELKRNVKEAWWRDMVTGHDDLAALAGAPEAVRDGRPRLHDHHAPAGLEVLGPLRPVPRLHGRLPRVEEALSPRPGPRPLGRSQGPDASSSPRMPAATKAWPKTRAAGAEVLQPARQGRRRARTGTATLVSLTTVKDFSQVLGPDAKELGTLTEPREFNLMFKTIVGALGGEEDAAFLRPETAQGIFVNFKNVLDSTPGARCRSASPRSARAFATRSRRATSRSARASSSRWRSSSSAIPSQSPEWYQYWRDRRYQVVHRPGPGRASGCSCASITPDELSHYSCGTADIEYAFPFLPPGEFGELEGIAHRGDFDLRSHMEGKLDPARRPAGRRDRPRRQAAASRQRQGPDLFDDLTNERFMPHVIEPSAGADRGDAGVPVRGLHEDQAPDENGKHAERVVMKFHPRLAPIKAAVFPLVKKDGMPEVAQQIYRELKTRVQRVLRREGRRRPPLSPPGRSRHAVLHHGRRPDAARPDRDDPRPRLARAVAHQDRRSVADVVKRRINK